MKNLNAILFSVLFVAVAVLYVLHFTGPVKNDDTSDSSQASGITAEGIAFVNIDTIIYKFDMFFDRREDLLAKQKSAEAQLNSKGTQYEKNARDFQEKVSKGLVTRATAAEMEQSLLQQQQELVTLRDNLQSDLLEEEQVMNRQIIDYITQYLEQNKSEFNVQYVLGKSFGSPILYGDPGLDITQKVTEALNRKYQSEKK
jgi:outer membrane protein